MKPSLLITGSNGLVGSQFITQFASSYHFVNLDYSNKDNPVDITNKAAVFKALEQSTAEAIIHCAAFTNVTEAWKQEGDKKGPAYQVNVEGTANIVEAASQTNKHLIHISTAYVFDGSFPDLYQETDTPNPIEWYGYTKAEAERVIQENSTSWTIFRIDQPFRTLAFERPDSLMRIITGLQAGTLPPQFVDHTFGPTFLDDFSRVLDWAVHTKPAGIYHGTSGEQWSDFDFAQLASEALGLSGAIPKGTLEEYLKTTNRPYQKNTALSTEKLCKGLPFKLHDVKSAVKSVVTSISQ